MVTHQKVLKELTLTKARDSHTEWDEYEYGNRKFERCEILPYFQPPVERETKQLSLELDEDKEYTDDELDDIINKMDPKDFLKYYEESTGV